MIAIIMATYNGEKYLREQLDSLLGQTVKDWVLHVCDDGSSDGTLKIVKEYIEAHAGKIYLHQNEQNLRSAWYFLAGLCQVPGESLADYYFFCDQDDRWDADKLEVSLAEMKRLEEQFGTNNPLLVYTDSRMTDADGNVLAESFQEASHYRKGQLDLAHLLMENRLPGCTECFNASLADKVVQGMKGEGELRFPEFMKMHDWWIALVAAAFGRIGYVNRATMDYRQHGGNVVGGSGFLSYLKNRLAALDKQKEAVKADVQQGTCFYQWYGSELKPKKRRVLEAFCSLEEAGFLRARYILFHYGFWKSGLVRNIALLLLI